MNIGKDLIFKDIDSIDVFDVITGEYLFTLDELKSASINHNEDVREVTGKGGRLLARFKKNKGVTVTGTNGIVSGGLMSVQTGSKFKEGNAPVMWNDYLTVDASHKSITKFKAVGTVGSEITELLVMDSYGEVVDVLEQAASVSSGKFTYNPETKIIQMYSDIPEGTSIVVYYKRSVANSYILDNNSDAFSGKAMLYINGLAEDRCSNLYRVQFFFPKVDFNGQFNLEFGDNPTVHSFEAVAMVGNCGSGSQYYTYTIFGVDAKDETHVVAFAYVGTDNMYYIGTDDKIYLSEQEV